MTLPQGRDPVVGGGLMSPREARARAHRRIIRRRRQVAVAGFVLCCTLIVMAGFRVVRAFTNGPATAAAAGSAPAPATTSAPLAGSASSSPGPSSQTSPTPSSASASARPVQATGVYAVASGGTARHGSGTLRTYRVEVETGTGQSATDFAADVDATLASASSWIGKGLWALQRVDGKADFVIRLATPASVDAECAAAGLDTRGYVSCRSGQYVMVNLDRWLTAVPHYGGDVALYRKYVVNHEVGHQLGYGHQACPEPGRPAPVMQQQTYGLSGCLVNGWPYVQGKLVSGPAVP